MTMNPDDALHKRLSGLAAPEPDPAARERALHQATAALRASQLPRPAAGRRWTACLTVPRWALAGGVAVTIMLLVVLGVTLAVYQPDGKHPLALTAERTLLSQMESLLGSQLDAVVERPDSEADIRLSAGAADITQPSLAQPVLIQFRRAGSGTTRVLSYSGRVVCVTLGGRRMCFEPLITGREEVLLLGETFCWTQGQPSGGLNGYQVTAQALPRS